MDTRLAIAMIDRLVRIMPLFFTYLISRRLEVRLRGRFSHLFWLSVTLMACYFVLRPLSYFLPPLHPAVNAAYNEGVLLICLTGAIFMYLFLLKLRERMGGEDPYDRMTRFVAPMILPVALALCMFVPLTHLAGLYAGSDEVVDLYVIVSEIAYSITDVWIFYFIFLSYLECKDTLKSLKITHKPLIISALCIISMPILNYGTLFLDRIFWNTPLYGKIFPYGYALFDRLSYSATITCFAAGMANMIVFYLRIRKPVKIKEEQEGFYPLALFQFVTKISEVIGSSSLTIFRSAIEGYNERFGRNISTSDTIGLSDVRDDEWQDLLAFILDVYYQCIGPVTWEVANDVEGLRDVVKHNYITS